MMGLERLELQSSGEKADKTCSLHGTGLTLKPLAGILVLQMFR